MILIELVYNLALLVALSVVSGFIDTRWKRNTRSGVLLQGLLFGGAAAIAMLRPFVFTPGLTFDGRSVMISLGGLFFGPWTAAVACLMTIPLRLYQGGPGMMMGVLVISSSAALGVAFHLRQRKKSSEISAAMLFIFGVIVHAAMLMMTVALPSPLILPVLKQIGFPVMLAYPLATVLIGKILSDQMALYSFLLKLKASEERYRELVESANSVILRMTPDGIITFFNEFAQRHFGFTSEVILGRNIVGTIVPPIDSNGRDLALVLKDIGLHPDRYVNHENENIRKDGSRCWLAWTNRGIFNEEGHCVAVLCIGTDVTQRRLAEEALRRSEAKQRTMVANISDVIAIIDAAGIIRYKSPNMQKWFGWNPKEVIGTSSWENIHPADIERTSTIFRDILEKPNSSVSGECRYRCKDGSYKWTEFTAVNLLHDSEIGGILLNYRDISQRKTAESEKAQLEAQFQQAQKMESVGQLAGGVAHDFNNILAAIMMRLSYLQQQQSHDKETQQTLDELMIEAQRAAGLVRQLLMFSRSSMLSVKVIDLNVVVANLTGLLRRLIGEHIKIHFGQCESPAMVEADMGMIEQVLMNLAVNARDAMPKGGVLTIQITPIQIDEERAKGNIKAKPGSYFCLSVADTGCGMAPDTLKRIFEPFFTTKEPGKGTGLGLATIHGIVEQHKGWIEVNSELEQGSVFRVFFPATTKPKNDPVLSEKKPSPRGNETILVVEDELALRRVVMKGLQHLGYRVLEAGNGQEAIQLWQQHGPGIDLLLSDLVMPEGLTGLDLAEKLKQQKPSLKVIISSGYGEGSNGHDKALLEGIAYMQKPFQIEALSRKVRECLDGV